MKNIRMAAVGLFILALIAVWRGRPKDPAPVVENPSARILPQRTEIEIPPETGPMASPQADFEFDYKTWASAIEEVGLLVPTELTPERYRTVLASPALTSADLLYKAAYVRYSIPRRSTDGGPAALLLAIYKSDQHSSVRKAAFVALLGGHLHANRWSLDTSEHSRGDRCPDPVLEGNAPQLGELAEYQLKQSKIDDLAWMIRCLLANEGDLPSRFDALASDIAQALASSRHTWTVQQTALQLARDPSTHSRVLIAAILDRYTEFDSIIIGALLPPYGSAYRLKEPLASAYRRFGERAKSEPRYRHLCSQLDERLVR